MPVVSYHTSCVLPSIVHMVMTTVVLFLRAVGSVVRFNHLLEVLAV